MRTNLETELFKESIKLWGIDSQILMLAEESSELSVATLHLLRKAKNDTPQKKLESFDKFAEEIADVEFLIAEMKDHFPDLRQGVTAWHIIKSQKLDRLIYQERRRMEREKGKRFAGAKT